MYYKKALEYSTNRNLSAECCFMAAKCMQNMFIMDFNPSEYDDFEETEKKKKDLGYREYFDVLENQYKNTDFYDEIIKECKYFEYYVSK